MSRYVQVPLDLDATRREDLVAALAALGIAAQTGPPGEPILLTPSLECAGEPVDVRIRALDAGSVEDVGFTCGPDRVRLVCGEPDRAALERQLLDPLRREVAVARASRVARAQGLSVEQHVEADGTRRLVLRRE
jgi:hypothetical protein